MGLTLDEFALWLNLEDVYWSDKGRQSIDAVIVTTSLLAISLLGLQFWIDVYEAVLLAWAATSTAARRRAFAIPIQVAGVCAGDRLLPEGQAMTARRAVRGARGSCPVGCALLRGALSTPGKPGGSSSA